MTTGKYTAPTGKYTTTPGGKDTMTTGIT